MASKTWSYKQITEATERTMATSHALAAACKSPDEAQIHRLFAVGAFNLWSRLTMGWQKPGDFARLEKLSDGPLKSEAPAQEVTKGANHG